jgi:hypothetical protein
MLYKKRFRSLNYSRKFDLMDISEILCLLIWRKYIARSSRITAEQSRLPNSQSIDHEPSTSISDSFIFEVMWTDRKSPSTRSNRKINLQMYWQNHLVIIHLANIGNESMDGKQCIHLGTYMLQAICEREC